MKNRSIAHWGILGMCLTAQISIAQDLLSGDSSTGGYYEGYLDDYGNSSSSLGMLSPQAVQVGNDSTYGNQQLLWNDQVNQQFLSQQQAAAQQQAAIAQQAAAAAWAQQQALNQQMLPSTQIPNSNSTTTNPLNDSTMYPGNYRGWFGTNDTNLLGSGYAGDGGNSTWHPRPPSFPLPDKVDATVTELMTLTATKSLDVCREISDMVNCKERFIKSVARKFFQSAWTPGAGGNGCQPNILDASGNVIGVRECNIPRPQDPSSTHVPGEDRPDGTAPLPNHGNRHCGPNQSFSEAEGRCLNTDIACPSFIRFCAEGETPGGLCPCSPAQTTGGGPDGRGGPSSETLSTN